MVGAGVINSSTINSNNNGNMNSVSGLTLSLSSSSSSSLSSATTTTSSSSAAVAAVAAAAAAVSNHSSSSPFIYHANRGHPNFNPTKPVVHIPCAQQRTVCRKFVFFVEKLMIFLKFNHRNHIPIDHQNRKMKSQ